MLREINGVSIQIDFVKPPADNVVVLLNIIILGNAEKGRGQHIARSFARYIQHGCSEFQRDMKQDIARDNKVNFWVFLCDNVCTKKTTCIATLGAAQIGNERFVGIPSLILHRLTFTVDQFHLPQPVPITAAQIKYARHIQFAEAIP